MFFLCVFLSLFSVVVADNRVFLFPNASSFIHLDEQHVAFMRTKGTVDPEVSGTPLYLQNKIIHSPGFDEDHCMFKLTPTRYFTRIVREADEQLPFGFGWHADLTFYKKPPQMSSVMGIELFNNQTKTRFKDMRHVLKSWNEEVGIPLEGLFANHSDDFNYNTIHPVVRKDVPDDPSLYVNRAFTRNIIGEENNELLEKLFDFIDNHKESEFEIEWTIDDMLIWDNSFLQHTAVKENLHARREIRRVIVSGEEPI